MALFEYIISKARRGAVIDTNVQTKLTFYALKNKRDLFYNGKLIDIKADGEFKINITKLEGHQTIILKDLQGETAEFDFWFTNKRGQIKNYELVPNMPELTYVKTLKNTLVLYTTREKSAFACLERYFKKLPSNFISNIKTIKMVPYSNKQNIAGSTKDDVTTLYNYKKYTLAQKKNILYHEIAHTWANKLMDKKYIDYSYTDYQEIVKKDNNYVSAYAEKFAKQHDFRVSEDFADGVAFYLIDEKKFTKTYPNRAKYFKELLKKDL